MASAVESHTLDTQTIYKLKRAILVQAQSAGLPAPQTDAGQPQNVIYQPQGLPAQHDDSMSVEPNNFTFNTQTPTRAANFRSQDLRSIKSSPIHASDKDEYVEPRNMHWSKSFAYGFDGSGDTQPMDSQIFKEYSEFGSSRIVLPGTISGVTGEKLTIAEAEVTTGGPKGAREPHKVDLTDEDELDVGLDFDDVSSLNGKDDTSPGADARIQAQTAALFKQPFPRTPLNPGTKRKRSHELETPDVRTPSTKGNGTIVRNLLGQVGMPSLGNMTQLFNNTQVGSSPAPRGAHSDSPFTKPSPSMFAGQYPTRDYSASSPVRPLTSDGLAHGPVNQYRRIEESQESRATREQRRIDLNRTDTLEDDDFDHSIPTQPQRHMPQKEKLKSTSAANHSPPKVLHAFPHQSRSKSVDNLPSDRYPRTPASKPSNPQPISPDPVSDVPDEPCLPDTVHEGDRNTIPIEGVQVPMTSSKRARLSQPMLSQVPSPSSSQRSAAEPAQTQMTVAVQDSQGEVNSKIVTTRVISRTVQSSAFSAHLVQQSQYSEPSTETRAITIQRTEAELAQAQKQNEDQRARTPEAELEDFVPSSPPVQLSEHDHEYEDDSDVEVVGEEEEMADAPTEEKAEGVPGELAVSHSPGHIQTSKPVLVGKETEIQELHNEEGVDMLVDEQVRSRAPTARSTTPPVDTSDAATKLMAMMRSTPPPVYVEEQRAASRERATAVSTGTEVYDTAVTHQTPSSSRIQQLINSERQSQVSPIKRLQDIAATVEPRRPEASFESQQLDDVIDNIMSEADLEFLKVTKSTDSPPRKRARTYKDKPRALREPSANVNLLKARKSAKVGFADVESETSEKNGFKSVSNSTQDNSNSLQKIRRLGRVVFTEDAATTITPDIVEPVSRTAESTPIVQEETASAETPSSVRDREAKGAQAALAARRLVASRKIAPLKKVKQDRKKSREKTGVSHRRHSSIKEDTNNKDIRYIEEESEEEVPEVARPHATMVLNTSSTEATMTSSAVRQFLPAITPVQIEAAPSSHKVLALFKGTVAYWYPATYLEPLLNGEKCKVRFCDGTVAVVDVSQTRVMELKVKDVIKVDIPGMRKGKYLVHGFDDDVESSYTDAQGHKGIKVVPHTTKDESIHQPTSVSIEQIYVTGNMLPTFSDRKFIPPSRSVERLSTPALQVQSEPTTPGSRSRRQTFSTSTNGQESKLQLSSGVFNNMAFAITFVDNRDEGQRIRDRTAKDINSNGGSVLDSGFEALFHTAVGQTSPKKSAARALSDAGAEGNNLRLRSTAEHLGFTAVIADRHCRTKKYLEALALGIPCLHHRWISDCIAQSTVLPFDRYLLPAGDSEFLAGAVRSRTLAFFDPAGEVAHLKRVIERRDMLLEGQSVLLVMSSAEKRNAYRFLAHAAGVTTVRCVPSLAEARKVLDSGAVFDIALCDGDKAKAQSALLGSKKQDMGTKKRKRGSGDFAELGKDLRVADSEFLVQSLILGAQADI